MIEDKDKNKEKAKDLPGITRLGDLSFLLHRYQYRTKKRKKKLTTHPQFLLFVSSSPWNHFDDIGDMK